MDMLESSVFYKIIATVFFIGYFPIAPGTVASAFAMIFIGLTKPSDTLIIYILIISFFLGILASKKVEEKAKKKDPSYIVIDEFAGYCTSVIFLPVNWYTLIACFVFFRFFDIIKPTPIRQIERKLSGGIGIMMDDIIAGLITNLLLRIFLML